MSTQNTPAKVGEGGEGVVAKSLISLGEGSGEGGEGCAAKSLKSLGRRLAKVAKHRTPIPLALPRALEAARCEAVLKAQDTGDQHAVTH